MEPPRKINSRLMQFIFTLRQVIKIAFRMNKRMLIVLFITSALWGFLSLPTLYLEKLIIDEIVKNIGSDFLVKSISIVGFLIFLKLCFELIKNILSRYKSYSERTISQLMNAELDMLLAKKISELDILTIEDPDFKDKFTKIEHESNRRAWGLMMPLSDIPGYIFGFITSLGILIALNPLITFAVILVSLPQFIVSSKFIKKEYELSKTLAPLHKVWGWLNYYLVRNRSYMEVKILNIQDFLANKLKKIQKESIGLQINLRKKRELGYFWTTIPFLILEFAISIWLITLVLVKEISLGSFQLYLRALNSAQNNLTGLVSSILEIYENYIYVSDLVWFLNLKPAIDDNKGGLLVNSTKELTIEFKNVWFRYKEDQPWIIKNVSFKILGGQNLALVGLNGAGKSTLIKLLARFYDPQKGEILIQNMPLNKLDLLKWRECLAVLFQEFEKYPFSVKESVGYGDIQRIEDFEGIRDSVELTGMRQYVESLPLKYANPLDPEFEKGIRPSIGQVQRLGISRIVFRKNAQILIMDEPTSNVDPQAEEKIFKEVLKIGKNKIMLFVTQRFSTVRQADKIIVLDKGQIIEEGTHKYLMKYNGKYAKLFRLQAKGYK